MKPINQDAVPATLDEAVQALYDALEPGEMALMKATQPHSIHHDFGRYLRNTWSLWGDTPLTRDIKQRFKIFGHGDDNSGIILHLLWQKVIGNPPWITSEHTVEHLVESYKRHWRSSGINPETGKEL